MKKLPLGLVVAAFCASQAAVAVAGDEKLSFYGQADVSVDFTDDSDETNLGVSSNSSRLGAKGSIELDKGYTAFYQGEWGIGFTGEKDWVKRNRFVGIRNDKYGQVLIGHHDTPMKKLGRSVDLFWSEQLGESRSVTAQNGADARLQNAIIYSKAINSNIKVTAAYFTDIDNQEGFVSGTTTGNVAVSNQDDNTGAVVGGSIVYSDEKFMVGLGFESRNGEAYDYEPDNPTQEGDGEDATTIRLVGSYKINNHKIVGFFESATDVGGLDGMDQTIVGIGWSMKQNKLTYKAQFYSAGEYDDTDVSNGDDTDATLLSAGVEYAHSKTVECYFTGGVVTNEDNASYTIIGNGHDDSTAKFIGGDSAGISAGVRLKF